MDCSSPGSSVHGIYQARVLEWGAIAFSEVLVNRWMETEDVTHTHTHARAHTQEYYLAKKGMTFCHLQQHGQTWQVLC